MTITHHLDDATLMSFAAGAMVDALAAVAAAHIALCPRCRREVAALERVGAALVADLAPARLDRPEPDTRVAPDHAGRVQQPAAPLARLLGEDLDSIKWRWIGSGVWQCPVPLTGQGTLNLIKVAPGRAVPEHGHSGSELTLVLRGTLCDETGVYGRGDVADLDEEIAHHPRAGRDTECICLVASEKPARFHGLVARLMRPWHGM
jgi:putative transcriptional regulator